MTQQERVALVGMASRQHAYMSRPKLDEMAFEVTRAALRDAGVQPHEVGATVLCHLDLYDGVTIANGLTSPAAAGYLDTELRIEADATDAIVAARAMIAARQAEFALVVAVNSPSTDAPDSATLRRFTDQISSYSFEPHFARPVGMTSTTALGMHATAALDRGEVTLHELAEYTAAAISRGDGNSWAGRTATTASEVLAAPTVAWPLTELMLPAESVGAVALVLGSEARSRRARRIRGWLAGWGTAMTHPLHDPRWLDDPYSHVAAAASAAYERAGVDDPASQVDIVEASLPSPALRLNLLRALGLSDLPDENFNPSGGSLSSFPGVADGALRTVRALEALEALDDTADERPRRAVVHGMDNLLGPISSAASVLVVEKP